MNKNRVKKNTVVLVVIGIFMLSGGLYPLIRVTAAEELEEPTHKALISDKNKLKLIAEWQSPQPNPPRWISSVAFSADGKYAASGGRKPGEKRLEGGILKLWDVNSGKEIKELKGHTRDVNSVAFSPNNALALSASTDGTVRLWDVANGKEIRVLKKVSLVKYPLAFAAIFSPDGQQVLVGTSENPSVRLLDASNGQEIKTFNEEFSVHSLAFSPDGKSILTVSTYDLPKLWDVGSGKKIRTFKLQKSALRYLLSFKGAWISGAFSPDGKFVLVANSDGLIRLWDVTSGEEVRTFVGHKDHVTCVAFSHDGKFIVSGSKDMTIRLWDMESGQEIDHVNLRDTALTIAFSPTDNSFLVGTEQGALLYFNLI